MTSIAVLGAGIMGAPISANLAAAGHEVHVWNRTREKAEAIDGAAVADSPAEAVAGADIVLTMLSDADAVISTFEDAHDAIEDGALWLQMSTIGLTGTEECIALANDRGLAFVDAPVLGTKGPAEQGKLVVLASGPDEAKERSDPIFDVVGQRTLWLGPAGAGTRCKLVANTWILTIVEGLAETIALAEGLGVNPQDFLGAIEGGAMDLPYAHIKGEAMISRSFAPAFSLDNALKDARLVLEAAERQDLDLPLPRLIADRMATVVAAGHGDEDMAAVFYANSGSNGAASATTPATKRA
ncbi:MAG: 3-hydroxyisobutyrate dehydrogenase [Solirubrobacteraceae bacterium]|jgi:3-hydroxyisobutyrate dehydrogenase|nr:3-hydroxyisobutyrate dehydrogenase [Solirubrobacteraceae bacterium]